MLGLSRYQWTVLFAAWLGWGFDVFDSLLFNYVAPNCVPTLLGLPIGSPQAKQATLFWTGLLTSLLLLGWATGGVLFGLVCDRIGRTRTLLLTMLLYAVGTAACAFAPNIWWLLAFRLLASLGIGGEWAAGAAMVAETVPEARRVEAGALLYTAAPMGLFLATFVNLQVAGHWLVDDPARSWRYVFLAGLLPAAAAFVVRLFVREPERWQGIADRQARIGELFGPGIRRHTLSGFLMALVALLTWWSCNAFIPVVSGGLARTAAEARGLDAAATLVLVEHWKTLATSWFNLGGLIGTLLTIPAAKLLGRKAMFTLYWMASAAALFATFGLDLEPETRLYLYFAIGLTVFGVFGSFTYYLPELFPTRLRGTGSGFCYNIGRVVAAVGPFLVGSIAARGSSAAVDVLFYVGFVPLAGLLFMPWVVETRGRVLA
ncbi:MAG: MFS transporter [Gammaproteobacteria bacterium]|nr:MFS transporter [Gammaproteobacteria bacterium]